MALRESQKCGRVKLIKTPALIHFLLKKTKKTRKHTHYRKNE